MSIKEQLIETRNINRRIGIDALKDIQEALAVEVAALARPREQFGHFHRKRVAWLNSASSDLHEGVR